MKTIDTTRGPLIYPNHKECYICIIKGFPISNVSVAIDRRICSSCGVYMALSWVGYLWFRKDLHNWLALVDIDISCLSAIRLKVSGNFCICF